VGLGGSLGDVRRFGAADRADSHAERLLVRILRRAGITGWVLAHPFGPWRLDVSFPELRLAVEVDGWAWHVDQPRFANDRAKGNALVAADWTILRFTWTDVADHPDRTLATLRRALAHAT
jgi:very-short-patch-repair endonuclease